MMQALIEKSSRLLGQCAAQVEQTVSRNTELWNSLQFIVYNSPLVAASKDKAVKTQNAEACKPNV
jgi:hypothetical protein